MVDAILTVKGMHCPKCTARVEHSVGMIECVERVSADFEADRVELSYDGKEATLEAACFAIEEQGFSVVR